MHNLKDETLEYMFWQHLKVEDIDWIGGKDFTIPVDVFFELADTNYDSGYGTREVAGDLRIVFKTGQIMTRWEYDGAEGWETWNFRKPDVERTDIVLTSRQMEEKYKSNDWWWADTHTLWDLNLSRPLDWEDRYEG